MSKPLKPEVWSEPQTVGLEPSYWVYCIYEESNLHRGPCKVGVATRMATRLSSLQGGNWRKLNLAWQIRFADRRRALDMEQRLLIQFRPDIYREDGRPRLRSEWVDAGPYAVLAAANSFVTACDAPLVRVAA